MSTLDRATFEPTHLARIVDHAPSTLMLLDTSLTIRWVNGRVLDDFGYEPAECIGRNGMEFLDPDWEPLAFESITTALGATGRRAPMLFRGVRKDGSKLVVEIWADVQISTPDIEGLVVGIRRWDERFYLDQAIESMEASWPLVSTYELLVAVAESEVLDARAAVLHDQVGDRFAGVVASSDLAPELCGPTLASPREVVEAWRELVASDAGAVRAVDSLPAVIRGPAEGAGFRALWIWPSSVRKDRPRGAIVIGWRTEQHLDADQTRRLGFARVARLAGLALERVRSEERSLVTMLFTDIVGSTDAATRHGDAVWRQLLARHDEIVRWCLSRHHGREVKHTGDGFLVTFDRPTQAIRAALDIAGAVQDIGIEVRAGIHLGEVEERDGDIGGVGVHIAARIMSAAAPSEILVSRTVRDVVSGSEVQLDDRGEVELRGVAEPWRVYAATGSRGTGPIAL